MLVIRRIHTAYHLRLRPDQRDAAVRAHDVHAPSCPVYRTLHGCIEITTSLDMQDMTEAPT